MKTQFKTVPLSDIVLVDRSLKKSDPVKFTKLKYSIRDYGQLVPLIVNDSMELLKGYKRYQALVEIGSSTADVIVIYENVNEDQLRLELEFCKHEIDPIEFCYKLQNIDRKKHNLPLSDLEISDLVLFPKVDKVRFDRNARKEYKPTSF